MNLLLLFITQIVFSSVLFFFPSNQNILFGIFITYVIVERVKSTFNHTVIQCYIFSTINFYMPVPLNDWKVA